MRLSRLLLENYGVFERTEITLSAVPGTIDLVVAPNGAGKSILRGALHDLLFGIGNQSPLDFRFGYRGMALHAEAVTPNGQTFDFGWRKQGRRFFNGDPVEAGTRLAAALGQVKPRQLEHLFALDTHRLREGGRELASGGDDLGVALLSGTGELASARRLRSSLEARRREIWEKGKLKPSLNAASRALDSARAALREATQPPREREAQQQAVADARHAVSEAEASHRSALERTRRTARIGRTRKPLQDLAEAEAWLAAHPEAPALSPGLAQELEGARAALSVARATLATASAHLAQARDYALTRERDAAALAEEGALTRLSETIRSIEDAQRDLPATRAARDAAAARIAAIVEDIGADLPPEDARALLPPVAAVAAARDLITRHEAARSKLEDAVARAAAAARELDDVRQQAPDVAEAPEDTAALAALLREIRAAGDPAAAAHAANQAAATAASEGSAALVAVPGWNGDLAALRACAAPAEPALQRLADTLAEASARHANQTKSHAALLDERDSQARALAALRDARVAEPARLAGIRAFRDEGWRLLQQRLGGTCDEAAERAYAAGESLAVRFDRHLREADAVADERATDSARVAEAARLDRALADTQALDDSERARAEALQARESARTAWRDACVPISLAEGATLAEARAFLAARETALRRAEAAEAAGRAAASLAAAHAAFAARIGRHVGAGAGESLTSYLAAADRAIEARSAAASRRLDHAAALRRAQKNFDQAARDQKQAAWAMEQWHDAWAQALSALGRPAGETPAATTEILARLEELRGHVRDLADRAPRVTRMEEAIAAFEAAVSALATRLAYAPGGDPTATARALAARLKQALEGETRSAEAEQALKTAGQSHAEAIAAEAAARQALDALIAATGAATGEAADLRLAASRDRNRMETQRDAAAASLAEEGDGLPHDLLRADLASLEPGAMGQARESAERDLEAAARAQQVAAVALSQARKAYDDAASATSATDAAADHAAAVTRFGRLLEDELVLRVASDMLARAMDAVEQNAGEGAPGRISRAFAAVTGGAYAVVPEDDGGRTILRIRETAFPQEDPRAIEALSEGTRDQLYLALRIVALEDFTAVSPPLPFIADDVLQTFDDTRALAALRALLELSQRVQVIVLTHHQHLAALSRSLPAGCVHIRTL